MTTLSIAMSGANKLRTKVWFARYGLLAYHPISRHKWGEYGNELAYLKIIKIQTVTNFYQEFASRLDAYGLNNLLKLKQEPADRAFVIDKNLRCRYR
jgi:hypothetical protein